MNLRLYRLPLLALAVFGGLGGCSPSSQPAPVSPQQAIDADAAQKLDTYRELLHIKNDEMAVSMGHDILDRYPNSAAAKEVQQTLPDIEKRYKEASEKYRLTSLWVYQVAPMEGGTQSTAAIYNSKPSGSDRVQLVLRRHTAWGQSVFLYGGGHGFVCHGNCTVAATFDSRALSIKAYAPTTGEPALMIADDKAFLSMLSKAGKISLRVIPRDTNMPVELVYEVGGFEPAKWLAVHGGKKK